ncbi:MAG: gluconolaconase [Dehalococcoidia bacterium]|nr:gluconolaconase [Dehalococcoidia bacterium]
MPATILPAPTVLLSGLNFPECPRWHGGKLWFSDMHAHKIMTVDLQGKSDVVVTLNTKEYNDRPAGIGFLPDGSFLFVAMRTRKLLRYANRTITLVADLGSFAAGMINDMEVDSKGRAYIGGRGAKADGTWIAWGSIILVTTDGKARVVATDIHGPNGAGFTRGEKIFILAETHGNKISAFDVEPDGSLTHRRVFAETGPHKADGICIDAEGAVWVCSPLGKEAFRIKEGGEITHRIVYTDRSPIACILGGPDGRTLFLTNSRFDLPNMSSLKGGDDDKRTTAVGWIETIHVDVPGPHA